MLQMGSRQLTVNKFTGEQIKRLPIPSINREQIKRFIYLPVNFDSGYLL